MSWISDSLIELIGLTDQTTVAYLIAMAKDATTVDTLKRKVFNDELLPNDNPKTAAFIQKMFD